MAAHDIVLQRLALHELPGYAELSAVGWNSCFWLPGKTAEGGRNDQRRHGAAPKTRIGRLVAEEEASVA